MTAPPLGRLLALTPTAFALLALAMPAALHAGGNPFDKTPSPRSAARAHARPKPARRGAVRPRPPRKRSRDNGVRYVRSKEKRAQAKGSDTSARWPRRRGGRRIAAADWDQSACTQSAQSGDIAYLRCDGAWWERVFERGEVAWVEVVRPH